ncbi:MAG TPA: hypothetical protein VGN88_02440 [Phycisphaerae bacterium]|jgi:hypothetical protein
MAFDLNHKKAQERKRREASARILRQIAAEGLNVSCGRRANFHLGDFRRMWGRSLLMGVTLMPAQDHFLNIFTGPGDRKVLDQRYFPALMNDLHAPSTKKGARRTNLMENARKPRGL